MGRVTAMTYRPDPKAGAIWLVVAAVGAAAFVALSTTRTTGPRPSFPVSTTAPGTPKPETIPATVGTGASQMPATQATVPVVTPTLGSVVDRPSLVVPACATILTVTGPTPAEGAVCTTTSGIVVGAVVNVCQDGTRWQVWKPETPDTDWYTGPTGGRLALYPVVDQVVERLALCIGDNP